MSGLEDEEGRPYTGRVTGALIAGPNRQDVEAYLTDDERVLIYDGGKQRIYDVSSNAERDLRDAFDDGEYVAAMAAIGEEAVINL